MTISKRSIDRIGATIIRAMYTITYILRSYIQASFPDGDAMSYKYGLHSWLQSCFDDKSINFNLTKKKHNI